MKKMDIHNLTAKDIKKLHIWLRALIQILYFLFIPSVYTAAFAGVKYIFTQIGAVTGDERVPLQKKAVIVMCADNGIVEEGISQSGQEVTYQVAESMGKRKSSVCLMAAQANAKVIPIDVGIAAEETPEGVWNKKVSRGTKNFLKQPASTV